AHLCRSFLLPLLLVPVQALQGLALLTVNTAPAMPSKSVGQSKRNSRRIDGTYVPFIDEDAELSEVDISAMLPAGMIIPPKDLEYGEQLGSGAQGAVYKGTLLSSDALVAIKSIRK